MMQLSCVKLVDLRRGEHAILDRIDLPADDARRLMELGFLPGTQVTAGHSAPGGDPRVFQVDGSEIALRRKLRRDLSSHVGPEVNRGCLQRLQRRHSSPAGSDPGRRKR